MKLLSIGLFLIASCLVQRALGQNAADIGRSLALHASFDRALAADFSRGDKTCYVRQGKDVVPAVLNDEVKITEGDGRFGSALHFTKKGYPSCL